jgi:hypothetical protein
VELDFEEDEGLGHQSAFRYDSNRRILALQGNRTGVGYHRFSAYLNKVMSDLGHEVEVSIHPIVQQAAANKALSRGAVFRKIVFTVHDPEAVGDTLERLEPRQSLIGLFSRQSRGSNAARLTVELSVGHSDRELDQNIVQRIIRSFSEHGAEISVSKLRASGYFDGENEELNLLPTKLSWAREVNLERRSLSYLNRARWVEEASEAVREELRAVARAHE